jgi:hypothetical protein
VLVTAVRLFGFERVGIRVWLTGGEESDVGEHVEDVDGCQGGCCVDLERSYGVLFVGSSSVLPVDLEPAR